MKHFAQIYLAAILLCCTSLAAASPWDDQIAQWKLESINLKSGQIPTLESQAKNGDVRATYLLYLERGQTRFKYAQSSGAVLVGELAKSIAETGNPIGMRMLCFLYREGEGGLPKNAQTAFQWCYRSGQLGLVDGMSAVANYYFYGTGTPKDDGKAFEWHQKSANANDSRGMYGVGWAYETGKGVAKDAAAGGVRVRSRVPARWPGADETGGGELHPAVRHRARPRARP